MDTDHLLNTHTAEREGERHKGQPTHTLHSDYDDSPSIDVIATTIYIIINNPHNYELIIFKRY